MGLLTWIRSKLFSGEITAEQTDEQAFFQLMGETYVRELAFWTSVNMIANAVSKCEFKTFQDGREIKESEYYLWNMEPNKNQCSSEFIHKWISQLYRNNEALVIEQNGQLLVADSYDRKPYALYEDVFTQVQIGGRI